MHQTVHVELGERAYDVEIGPNLLTPVRSADCTVAAPTKGRRSDR